MTALEVETAFAKEVITMLNVAGVPASWEYPGFISVPVAGGALSVGTSNGDWGYDFTNAAGFCDGVEGGPESLPITAKPEQVSVMILLAMAAVVGGAS